MSFGSKFKDPHSILLQQAVEQSPTSIVITDCKGNIEYTNPRFEELTGYTSKEVMGQNPRILQSGLTPPDVFKSLWSTVSSGRVWSGEVLNRRKDSSLYWGSLRVAPVFDSNGEVSHYVGIESDVTERKSAALNLEHANAELKEANEKLRHFTSVVSHDLRSPLSTIVNAVELVESELCEKLSDDGNRAFGIIRNKALHMSELLRDLLEFSRADSQEIQREPVQTLEIVQLAISNLSSEINSRNANVEVNGEFPVVVGSRTQFLQLFQNIIQNGIKYCRAAQPHVVISGVCHGDRATFSVSDNGIGIPEDKRAEIFESFTRLDTKKEFPGTGIGLATAKKIVDRYHGRIAVHANSNGGSVFTFSFPL